VVQRIISLKQALKLYARFNSVISEATVVIVRLRQKTRCGWNGCVGDGLEIISHQASDKLLLV